LLSIIVGSSCQRLQECFALHASAFTDALHEIRSASALTEDSFLQAGTTLEASIEILANLTSTFEAVVAGLKGDNLNQALKGLAEAVNRVDELGKDQTRDNAGFDDLYCRIEAIRQRIARMNVCLKDVDCLAINSKIAAANINAPGADFTTFANDIGHTLDVVKRTLSSFTAELHVVRQQVMTAHAGQLAFKAVQQNATSSITQRLATTIQSITSQHERAARSGREVKLMTGRIRQRVCDAIVALQIGDITRQRLEHAESALNLAAAAPGRWDPARACEQPLLDDEEQRRFSAAAQHLQSAQLSDAVRIFDRELRQIVGSLSSLAAEARTLRSLGDSAYGASDRAGGTFIMELEGQVGEALALFEGFEIARDDAARVTASVSKATVSLRGHLQRVQSLEADIRIMGLNTTFKCARIGREGAALSVIAQELRAYASGFAKEAAALEEEVENVVAITGSLVSETESQQILLSGGGAYGMRESHAMLQRMGEILDVAVADLERGGDSVVALLVAAVANLEAQNEIGRLVREAAGNLMGQSPHGLVDFHNLAPHVEQMIEVMAGGYTMADERSVHDRVLGRVTVAPPVHAIATSTEVADFLF
jgi:hypothetical protein